MKRVPWPFGPKTILGVQALPGQAVRVTWEGGERSDIHLSDWIASSRALAPLSDPALFAKAHVGEYGSTIAWIDDELEIDSIHLQLIQSEQRGAPLTPDALIRWRARFGLTQAKAARELGVSPRQWQNYESGRSFLPWTIALACAGWAAVRSRAA